MSLGEEKRKQRERQKIERADAIIQARKAKGLTQEGLARKSRRYGLSYLQKIENGVSCSEKAFSHFMGLLSERRA